MQTHYDVLVIGGGPGGTPAAMALAQAGKRVLLVERGAGLGGTCLFEGCIPSKIFRESARRLRELREAADFGLCLPTKDVCLDWLAIQQRKRNILQKRSQAAIARVEKIPSLDFIRGEARFLGPREVEIVPAEGDSCSVQFEQAIIATGSVPFRPPIPGSEHERVLDSEAILNIDHIPDELVIIGGGPIGVELGQIFHTFGSKVILLEAGPRILGPVDDELAGQLQQQMTADGIEIYMDCKVERIVHSGQSVYVEYCPANGEKQHQFADTVLVATGRRPNVAGLGLENTAIDHDTKGIRVDDTLQTSEPGIYAVGDVIGQPMFAHWATAQSLALARHLLQQHVKFPTPASNTAVIFSHPEIGIAGLDESQANTAGLTVDVARYDYRGDARAQISGHADGILKIVYERDTHKIVGIHVAVDNATTLMGEAALIIRSGLTLEALAAAIHPHPTLSESFALAARAALAQALLQKH
ncbi:MAG TPA: NAD(P)/FAD-dependent oxidoreductase [Gammaproteobacteria bacterium]|nr:NAD(P)/FAD-dependent oxidoreductase [Gammaproteobacteria bacterium]